MERSKAERARRLRSCFLRQGDWAKVASGEEEKAGDGDKGSKGEEDEDGRAEGQSQAAQASRYARQPQY